MTKKRDPVKWIRDRAKGAYQRGDMCFVCGTNELLELHHTHSIAQLLAQWSARNSIDISSDEAILAVRDRFIEEHHDEIYIEVFTLCKEHHMALHKVYGKAPELHTAKKQRGWLERKRANFDGTLEFTEFKVEPSKTNWLERVSEPVDFRKYL